MTMNKFYDTSSLLLITSSLSKIEDNIIISSITLQELENIKISSHKDPHIKYAARQLLQWFDKNPDKYTCIVYKTYMDNCLTANNIEVTNDTRILATAVDYYSKNQDNFYFITNDLALKAIAGIFFKDLISINEETEEDYSGYLEIELDNEQMAMFYSDPVTYGQSLKILTNQYLNIYNSNKECVDTLCWTGKGFRPLKYKSFSSQHFGNVKPYKNDIYQAMVADSLINNKITIIKGPAGTGKSHLALGFLFSLLEHNKIDKIVIFCNTVATKNSAKLGFYPGSKDEKLLDSQIGNFLSSKLGGMVEVERLISSEQLILLPMSDIRGYDTSGMNAGIYISEAQNLDISLMKLALQRIGADCFCIIDGDAKTQVDDIAFAGLNNGMRRVSKIFRGYDFYGEIELKEIHRSVIGKVADEM